VKANFKLPKAVKAKWVKALRSGEYKQGIGHLEQQDYNHADEKIDPVKYCCLGVACHIGLTQRRKPADKNASTCGDSKPEVVSTKFLPSKVQDFLAEKNDDSKWGFEKIADWIDENL